MLHFAVIFCVLMVCIIIECSVVCLYRISLLSHYIVPEEKEVSSGKASSPPGASTGTNTTSGTVTMVGCGKPQDSAGVDLKVTHTTSLLLSSLLVSNHLSSHLCMSHYFTSLHMT
jgi:hypothetical protein